MSKSKNWSCFWISGQGLSYERGTFEKVMESEDEHYEK